MFSSLFHTPQNEDTNLFSIQLCQIQKQSKTDLRCSSYRLTPSCVASFSTSDPT